MEINEIPAYQIKQTSDELKARQVEAEKIISLLGKDDFNIALVVKGKEFSSEELAESHAVVVHVMPGFLDADDESDNIDLIYLSKEDGLSDEEMCGALAFATVKAFIKSSEAMAKRDGTDAEFENINYDEVVDAVMEKIGEVVVKQSLRDCLWDLFDFDKED